MGLLGLFGGDEKKKNRDPRAYYVRPVPKSDENSPPPWVQALQQANSTRSTFWNNIKGEGVGQSWNRAGNRIQKMKERARMRRRRLL